MTLNVLQHNLADPQKNPFILDPADVDFYRYLIQHFIIRVLSIEFMICQELDKIDIENSEENILSQIWIGDNAIWLLVIARVSEIFPSQLTMENISYRKLLRVYDDLAINYMWNARRMYTYEKNTSI